MKTAAGNRHTMQIRDFQEKLETTAGSRIQGRGCGLAFPQGHLPGPLCTNRSEPKNDMANPQNIGRGELEILHYITDHHPLSVQEVAHHMAEAKGHARTTVLTVMERLRKKGYLTRKRIGGVYRYSPCIPKANLLQKLIREFVETTLEGSAAPFVSYLVQEAKLTERELADLKRFVRDLVEQKDRKK